MNANEIIMVVTLATLAMAFLFSGARQTMHDLVREKNSRK